MRAGVFHAAALAAAIGGFGPALAQSPRTWVDPPSDVPAAREPAQPAQAAPEASQAKAPEAQAKQAVKPAETNRKVASKPKKTREAKAKLRTRSAAIAPAPMARRSLDRRFGAGEVEAQAYPPGTRYETSGSRYEVMRLRTYELPDGRRIQVLTRPPEAPTYPTYPTYPAPYYR